MVYTMPLWFSIFQVYFVLRWVPRSSPDFLFLCMQSSTFLHYTYKCALNFQTFTVGLITQNERLMFVYTLRKEMEVYHWITYKNRLAIEKCPIVGKKYSACLKMRYFGSKPDWISRWAFPWILTHVMPQDALIYPLLAVLVSNPGCLFIIYIIRWSATNIYPFYSLVTLKIFFYNIFFNIYNLMDVNINEKKNSTNFVFKYFQ